jgi:hypothetical protein
MRRETFEMQYYNTYYYANIVKNVLEDPFGYIRTIHDLFENDGELGFCDPFPKHTALHQFAWFSVELLLFEDLSSDQFDSVLSSQDKLLPINRAMEAHGIEHTTLAEWMSARDKTLADVVQDDLDEYVANLCIEQGYENFLTQTTDEIFFVLFLNRGVLAALNQLVAGYIQDVEPDGCEPDVQNLFERPGMLKRQYIPQWARRAVFFRDRGRCVYCERDLSGLVSVESSDHFDHMIPLAEGGINDVTNLQLLCGECNLKKGDRCTGTSCRYELVRT